MKKFISFFAASAIALALVVGASSCGNKDGGTGNTSGDLGGGNGGNGGNTGDGRSVNAGCMDSGDHSTCVEYQVSAQGASAIEKGCRDGGGTYYGGGCPAATMGSCAITQTSNGNTAHYTMRFYSPMKASEAKEACDYMGGSYSK